MTDVPHRLSSRREALLAARRKDKLRNDLLNKFGIDQIDQIDNIIAKHADSLLSTDPYMSVYDKLADLLIHAEKEPPIKNPQQTLQEPPDPAPPLQNPSPEEVQPQRTPIYYTNQPSARPDQEFQEPRNMLNKAQDWGELARKKDQMSLEEIERENQLEQEKKKLYKYF